jgi:hypothetical protein
MTDVGTQLCRAIGVALHFAWMTSFFIMTYVASDILCIFSNLFTSWFKKTEESRKVYFCWILSGMYISICVALDFLTDLDIDYGSERGICFIQPTYYFLILFIIPVVTLVSINFICFLVSVISIHCNLAQSMNPSRHQRVFIFSKIFSLIGFTWLLGLLPTLVGLNELWYPFIITNSLQGFYIFLAFGFNKNVRNAIFCAAGLTNSRFYTASTRTG